MKHFRLSDLLGAVVLGCGVARRQRRTARARAHVRALTHDPMTAAMDAAWSDR